MDEAMARRLRLVAICGPDAAPDGRVVMPVLRALEAGLPALMLRAPGVPEGALAPAAEALAEAVVRHGALFIMNRHLALAARVGAAAAQLGRPYVQANADAAAPAAATKDDSEIIAEARAALGPGPLLGWSAHAAEEARRAFAAGADYAVLSPIFETPSKRGILAPLGLEPLREAARRAAGPVLALGGLEAANARAVLRAGARGIAVIRAIRDAPDAGAAVTALLNLIEEELHPR